MRIEQRDDKRQDKISRGSVVARFCASQSSFFDRPAVAVVRGPTSSCTCGWRPSRPEGESSSSIASLDCACFFSGVIAFVVASQATGGLMLQFFRNDRRFERLLLLLRRYRSLSKCGRRSQTCNLDNDRDARRSPFLLFSLSSARRPTAGCRLMGGQSGRRSSNCGRRVVKTAISGCGARRDSQQKNTSQRCSILRVYAIFERR